MATINKSSRKMHLTRPMPGATTMCGRGKEVDQTTETRKVTCKTCRNFYEKNKKWYAAARRKLTKSGK